MQDNILPHVSIQTVNDQNKFIYEVLQYPPYSLNLFLIYIIDYLFFFESWTTLWEEEFLQMIQPLKMYFLTLFQQVMTLSFFKFGIDTHVDCR